MRLRGGREDTPEEKAREGNEEVAAKEREIKEEIKSEMAVAPGGFITQTIVRDPIPADKWDAENIVMFNVQLVNATSFEKLLGLKAPNTPITPC